MIDRIVMEEPGYPIEESLHYIKSREAFTVEAATALLDEVAAAWQWSERVTRELCNDAVDGACTEWRFSTGGWSGNEELMAALRANTLFWTQYWFMTQRGGLFVFRVPTK